MVLTNLPLVAAASREQQPFPDVPFAVFSKFVEDHFISTVSLSTVLMVLFSVTENTDLLSLHYRQRCSERSTSATGWIRCFGSAVQKRLEEENESLLKESDVDAEGSVQKTNIAIGLKLDALARVVGLYPINKSGQFKGKLKAVSHKGVQPVYTLCPNTAICTTKSCNKKALFQWTRARDVPLVRLIKDFKVHEQVQVYSGHCKGCKTLYYADHERAPYASIVGQHERVYLNSAKYIKIGQSLWVDRAFTAAVLSGMYTFHASAAAYTEFWNSAFDTDGRGMSRRQVWQAFVQESIRLVASSSNNHFAIQDGLPIDEVTKEAFTMLGENGILRSADQHECSECTHKYKRASDVIPDANGNVSDMVGMEERIIDVEGQAEAEQDVDEEDEAAQVKMVVVDGIVMGYTVSLTMPDETLPWMPAAPQPRQVQQHDEEQVEQQDHRTKDHFTPPRMYCVETICAPCGVVVGWAKFAKSESPTNILNFLELVYPEKERRPSYICIDKACMVLKTVVNNPDWGEWLDTSRFIVDAYHYINHRASDDLCRTWCNPAPLNGSAPNLVIAERNAQGQLYYKRAFNTQACEQLNAWLGGFESILKRMTPGNFDWFLHTMLFYHTMQVIKKQNKKRDGGESEDEGDENF
ncbi:hypothetical protein JOM56_011580 [Amanita muscaria]